MQTPVSKSSPSAALLRTRRDSGIYILSRSCDDDDFFVAHRRSGSHEDRWALRALCVRVAMAWDELPRTNTRCDVTFTLLHRMDAHTLLKKYACTPCAAAKETFKGNCIFLLPISYLQTPQVRSGQIRSGQIRSNQVRSGQITALVIKHVQLLTSGSIRLSTDPGS